MTELAERLEAVSKKIAVRNVHGVRKVKKMVSVEDAVSVFLLRLEEVAEKEATGLTRTLFPAVHIEDSTVQAVQRVLRGQIALLRARTPDSQ